jgi:hypothetical protein
MNDVQYVQKDRIALELSETKAGPDFTPVSTILGLQKVWNLRRMNQEELVLAATKAAASGMSDAEARCRFGHEHVPPLAADEELAWTLCEIEQLSRSNGASATSGKQAADSTSRIKAVHISGLLALNGEKTDVPSNAMSPLSAWAAKINAMDTGKPSRASSSASEFSTASVADSVEFTETNPEALRGLGFGIDENDKAAHESEKQDISGVSTPSAPMQELCLETLEQEPASGGASISTSRVQVLDMLA